jgi:phage portal protein BeeE
MASIIDRLLGRTDLAVVPAIMEPEAKAAIGPGVASLTYGTPLHSLSRDPHRLMAEAQALFHTNGWVAAAERALGGRFVRMPWHLEDENGDTIDERSDARLQVPLKLLQRPNQYKTRAQVWGLTFRHEGLAGNGFWYLDQREPVADTPLEVLYINPARMTPVTNTAGYVQGWILDHPENQVLNRLGADHQRDGIPLTREEVIHFCFDEPDWGVWGVGIPESAQRKIELDRLTDTHAGGVLGSGGRLAGLITPKAGVTVQDDQWVQFVRDWRSITSDPDAAKRLQIGKMPLDFTQMTASPKDLQLIDVTKQTKEDILALWGVPLSQLGINVTAGLNADRSEADDAAIWETVKQRSDPFREKIQYELLDRWQAVGVKVTLIFDYPEFDDRAPLFEAVAKSVNAAITNDERRNILGLEPLEDEQLGKAIYIHSSLVRIDEEPAPEVPAPPPMLPPVATDEEEEVIEGKADLRKPLLGLRVQTETTWEPKLRRIISGVLAEQRRLALSKTEHVLNKKDLSWWNDKHEHHRFMVALEPTITDMAAEVATRTTRTVKKPEGKADTWLERVLEAIRTSVGTRITGINRTTREKIQRSVEAAAELGLSPAELGGMIEETGAFNDARAEMIARTETAQVYNDAALRSFGELEVQEVEAIDGDTDPECAARNGKRYPLEEALGITDHPNGTLDWVPVVKASLSPVRRPAIDDMASLRQTIEQAFARLQNPVINVTLPESKATLPADIRIVSMPNRIHHAIRKADGTIEGSMEGDA